MEFPPEKKRRYFQEELDYLFTEASKLYLKAINCRFWHLQALYLDLGCVLLGACQ